MRVFVSSTFLDMQTERDNLVTKTFPALRAKYRKRGAGSKVSRSRKSHSRRLVGLERFLPAWRAQAPTVTRLALRRSSLNLSVFARLGFGECSYCGGLRTLCGRGAGKRGGLRTAWAGLPR